MNEADWTEFVALHIANFTNYFFFHQDITNRIRESGSVFTNHSQERSSSFPLIFCKYECTQVLIWLNRMLGMSLWWCASGGGGYAECVGGGGSTDIPCAHDK